MVKHKPTTVASAKEPHKQEKSKKTPGHRLARWLAARRRWQRRVLYSLAIILSLVIVSSLVDRSFPEVKQPNWGMSFSVKYAKELGLDWQETYTALLDDMQIRNYRLMSYWDDMEPERGTYHFEDLDWQMDEAHKRGAKVSLAIGMRQPRWPECHKPKWYLNLTPEEQTKAIFTYVEAVVTRYKDHPALISYQMENEAVNTWFGSCTDKDIDKQRLKDEFALVKRLDPTHPVWMSLSDQHGLPVGQPTPDKYGYSVYRTVYNDKTGPFRFYITYPTPQWYHHIRAWWIKTFKNREVFIHELQLEPWGPGATVGLSVEEQNKSMDLDQLRTNVKFGRQVGKQDIYAWGGEWWYWRKVKHNDPSVWETAREELGRP